MFCGVYCHYHSIKILILFNHDHSSSVWGRYLFTHSMTPVQQMLAVQTVRSQMTGDNVQYAMFFIVSIAFHGGTIRPVQLKSSYTEPDRK